MGPVAWPVEAAAGAVVGGFGAGRAEPSTTRLSEGGSVFEGGSVSEGETVAGVFLAAARDFETEVDRLLVTSDQTIGIQAR